MNSQTIPHAPTVRHPGPHLGVVATIFVVLFLAGLYPVIMFGGAPYFPGPGESVGTIISFFQLRPSAVLLCAFFISVPRLRLASSPQPLLASCVSWAFALPARTSPSSVAWRQRLIWEPQHLSFGLWLVLMSRKMPLSCKPCTTFNMSLAGPVSPFRSVS